MLVIFLASFTSAQDRTFLFTVTPQIDEPRNFLVHYDAGYGERAFRPFGEDGIKQRAGVQAALGRGFTLLALSSLAVETAAAALHIKPKC